MATPQFARAVVTAHHTLCIGRDLRRRLLPRERHRCSSVRSATGALVLIAHVAITKVVYVGCCILRAHFAVHAVTPTWLWPAAGLPLWRTLIDRVIAAACPVGCPGNYIRQRDCALELTVLRTAYMPYKYGQCRVGTRITLGLQVYRLLNSKATCVAQSVARGRSIGGWRA